MRLLTLQDKIVIEQLYEDNMDLYECQHIEFKKREELLYNKMKIKMIKDLGIPGTRTFVPIWCWVVPKDKEINTEYIDELYNRMAPNCDRIVAIELEIPKEFIIISNFDHWKELLFNVTFGIDVSEADFQKLFEKQKGATLQATIPFISKDHIVKYIDFNDFKSKPYEATESMINDMVKKGSIKLDPTGQFIESDSNAR